MPAKFVIQRLIGEKKIYGDKKWVDTVWTSLATAREKFPKHTFREVMTEW